MLHDIFPIHTENDADGVGDHSQKTSMRIVAPLRRYRDSKIKLVMIVNQTVILEALTCGLEQADYRRPLESVQAL
jgi:hypothetical protein